MQTRCDLTCFQRRWCTAEIWLGAWLYTECHSLQFINNSETDQQLTNHIQFRYTIITITCFIAFSYLTMKHLIEEGIRSRFVQSRRLTTLEEEEEIEDERETLMELEGES